MTVISANQPQNLEAKQIRIQFFGLGNRSTVGVDLSGVRTPLEALSESAELRKFMRQGDTLSDLVLDLNRASESSN